MYIMYIKKSLTKYLNIKVKLKNYLDVDINGYQNL